MIEGFCMSKVANCTDSDNAIWSLLWKLNFDLSLCGVVTLYRSIKICNYKHASQNFIQSVSTNSTVKILDHKRSLGVRLNWTKDTWYCRFDSFSTACWKTSSK
jgi:hypothetical protein